MAPSHSASLQQPSPAPPHSSRQPAARFVMNGIVKVFVLCLVQSVFLASVHGTGPSLDEAVENRLRGTYKDLDINKDGHWNQTELKQDLSAMDSDGDGQITWEEWEDSMATQSGLFSKLGQSVLTEDLVKMAFQCGVNNAGAVPVDFNWATNSWIDTDGSGELSQEEFVVFFKKVFVYVISGHNDCNWAEGLA